MLLWPKCGTVQLLCTDIQHNGIQDAELVRKPLWMTHYAADRLSGSCWRKHKTVCIIMYTQLPKSHFNQQENKKRHFFFGKHTVTYCMFEHIS